MVVVAVVVAEARAVSVVTDTVEKVVADLGTVRTDLSGPTRTDHPGARAAAAVVSAAPSVACVVAEAVVMALLQS